MIFTLEELEKIARSVDPGAPEQVERDGFRYTFGQEYDDQGPMAYINDMDCLGKVAWPDTNRNTGNEMRPAGFTGAARRMTATPMHDAMWWEPYREGKKVYDSPEEVRFIEELLDWGVIAVTLIVERRESCGHWHECGHEALWGIESPTIGKGNYDYLATVYDDMISAFSFSWVHKHTTT